MIDVDKVLIHKVSSEAFQMGIAGLVFVEMDEKVWSRESFRNRARKIDTVFD